MLKHLCRRAADLQPPGSLLSFLHVEATGRKDLLQVHLAVARANDLCSRVQTSNQALLPHLLLFADKVNLHQGEAQLLEKYASICIMEK